MTDNLTTDFLERCEKITREFEKRSKWQTSQQLLKICGKIR